jgi:N utilization substance protein B
MLGLLYEAEAKEIPLARVLETQASDSDGYVADLAVCLTDRLDDIDRLLRDFAKGWDLERMPATDRAVLRIAVCELLGRDDVPTAVVISEAVELAKRYSTDDSSRFVNGVLSAIAERVREKL